MELAVKETWGDIFNLASEKTMELGKPYYLTLFYFVILMGSAMFMYPGTWIVRTDSYSEFALIMLGMALPPIAGTANRNSGVSWWSATQLAGVVLTAYLVSVVFIGLPQTIISFPAVLSIAGLVASIFRAIILQRISWFIFFAFAVTITSIGASVVTGMQPEAVQLTLAGHQSVIAYLGMIPGGLVLLTGFYLTSRLNTGWVEGSESGRIGQCIPIKTICDEDDLCIGCQKECTDCDDFIDELAQETEVEMEQMEKELGVYLDELEEDIDSVIEGDDFEDVDHETGCKMESEVFKMAGDVYSQANKQLTSAYGDFLNTVYQINRALMFVKPENMERDAYLLQQMVEVTGELSLGLKYADHERAIAGAQLVYDKWFEMRADVSEALNSLDTGADIGLTGGTAMMSIQMLSAAINGVMKAEKMFERTLVR